LKEDNQGNVKILCYDENNNLFYILKVGPKTKSWKDAFEMYERED